MSLFEQTAAHSNRQEKRTTEANDEISVLVEYYTDPLCSWSWAFEPQWRRLRYEYGEHLRWRYRMGGLIADWSSYEDPLNDVHRPSQMAPQWFQVQEMSGMPFNDQLWQADPPASSYPASIAVKAAERQGQAATESYLRRLREAAMIECRNIARQDVLLAIAQETATAGLLDLKRFNDDLTASETLDAFRQDLRDAAYYSIGRFPTLLLQRNNGRGLGIVGYRPYEALQAALKHLVPELSRRPGMPPEELAVSYVCYWQRVIARELAEMLGGDLNQASSLLESLVARGILQRVSDSRTDVPVYTN
jgi:putative protein-disulfide isomerase